MNRPWITRHLARFARTIALGVVLQGTARAQDIGQVFDTIKAHEGGFVVPAPYAAARVGTFDAATGRFTWDPATHDTIRPIVYYPNPNGQRGISGPRTYDAVSVNAVRVGLVFDVINTKAASMTLDVLTPPTSAGIPLFQIRKRDVTVLTADVGTAWRVRFTVTGGKTSYRSDTIVIKRPPVIGAGAFVVPALPVTVIYEPPQFGRDTNRAVYTTTRSIGTTITMSFSRESSNTTAGTPHFAGVVDLIGQMRTAATGLSALGSIPSPAAPYLQAAAAALSAVAGALGSAQAQVNTGSTVARDSTLQVMASRKDRYGTNAALGPGRGDLVVFKRAVKLVWLANGGPPVLAVLDASHEEVISVGFLRSYATTGWNGLSPVTVRALLALDPFVAAGPHALLPLSRFDCNQFGNLGLNATARGLAVSHTVVQSDRQATTSFTTRTEQDSPGLLSFLSLGVTEAANYRTNVTQSISSSTAVSSSVTASVDLYIPATEYHSVDVCYDRIFGTFALEEATIGPELLAGFALDAAGRPLPGQFVKLLVAGKTFWARTDAQGRYAFRAANIKPGAGLLQMGKVSKAIQLTGTPLRNVELRAEPLRP